MKDELKKINNTTQVIRTLDKMRLAMLLFDIKNNSNKYPNDIDGWVQWLNKDSGDNVFDI